MVEFTFVPHQSPDGRSRRRTNRKACETCRLRKRRCNHQGPFHPSMRSTQEARRPSLSDVGMNGFQSILSPEEVPESYVDAVESSQHHRRTLRRGAQSPSQDGQQDETNEVENDTVPRFIGDLNPEARLHDESHSPEDITSPVRLGVWIQPPLHGASSSTAAQHSDQAQITREQHSIVSDLIAPVHIAALSDLFFANVQPILPLLNEEEYRSALGQNRAPVALMHAVCLVAAKDSAAGPYLRYSSSPNTSVPVRSFCSRLHASIINAVTHPVGLRRITLARILGLLSLHSEGHDGAENASCQIAQACHHAQTLAIHLNRPSNKDNQEMKRTFWCLWTLDRINAATNSRPCILHDLDIGVEPPKRGEFGSPAFDIWFHIAQTLNRAIGLYRPSNPETVSSIDLDYTVFEQLVEEMQGWNLTTSTLATLRLFYLATAILAYRLRTIRTLPTTTSARLRQQLSAMQIIRQMQKPEHAGLVHPLPVVVYAVSLALSVSYQQMRFSRLVMDQQEAFQDFRTSCTILQVLQQRWSSADVMGSLSQQVLVELERMPSLSFIQIDKCLRSTEHDQSHLSYRDAAPQAQQDPGQESQDVEPACEMPGPAPHGPGHEENWSEWNAKVNDIFGGMDDMSWMYLAPGNSLDFESMPHAEMWTDSVQPMVP